MCFLQVLDIDGTQVKHEDIECETVEIETVEEVAETLDITETKHEEIEIVSTCVRSLRYLMLKRW